MKRVEYSSIKINGNIDLDSLFTPPDSNLLEEVSSEIMNISYAYDSSTIIKEYDHRNNRMLQLIEAYKSDKVHYFANFHPSINTDVNPSPVLLYANGLNQIDPTVSLDRNYILDKILMDLPEHFIIVPSYRGQALLVENKRYCSDGFFGDAYDGATIDA